MASEVKKNPASMDGVPDLAQLLYLEMPNVVHNLKCRYDKKEIYTGISSILIAVNPYELLPCYGQQVMELYSAKAKHAKMEPHVYDVAENAYRLLVKTRSNQSMIVCGESGAGKSESAKHLMRHLAYTTSKGTTTSAGSGGPDASAKGALAKAKRGSRRRLSVSFNSIDTKGITDSTKAQAEIERKVLRILAANPILEAFGNAKTVLNNNSSRFGKFTKLLFDDDSKNGVHIVGSAIETFLLEKSRVVFQTKGERNYHIFYQLMAGADSKTKATLGIDSGPRGFHYTSQSGCDTVQGIPDASRYKELISSLELAGFSSEDIEGIQQLIAFILHLSNVRFTIDDKDVCHVDAKTQASLEAAARLGGVTVEALTKCLCYRSLKISGKVIFKPYNAETSVVNRDSMAKSLFNCCFDFVVKTINKVMFVGDKSDKLMWIGILDVFGFECFAYNSFEQLCINLANERLQQFFNVHVIKSEQEEYEREAIYWSPVKVPDNQACLDMILKKTTGVLALLDTACATPKADDTVFTSIVFKEYKNHPSIKQVRTLPGTKGRSKVRINGFQVSHYARDVCYDAREFLKKNQDAPPTDMINLFRESESELFFKVMVGEDRASATSPVAKKKKGRAKRKTLSVGGNFAKQLRNLMKNLKTTRPFFIRCVKPNLAKKPNMWVDYMITNQLEAGGLIQALKIIKCGYPTRVDYKTIYTGYKKVLTNPPADLNERDFVEALMIANKFSRSQFVLGLTKVFFKSDQQDFVTQLLNPQNALSPEVVKGIERHLIRKKIIRTMAVVRAYARWQVLSMQKKQREAAFTLQAALQAYAAKRNLRNLRQANLSAFSAGQKSLAALAAGRRDEVSAVATQVAKWISAVSGLPVNEGMSFFDEAASANKLCMLLVVLGYPVTPHANVSPASSGARDNVSDFISGCKGLGVGSAQLMKLDDLFLLKRPLVALNMILNLCLSTQKRMDALPTVAFECSERKRKGQNLSKGICFYGEGKGILENMTDERRQELFQPGYIQRKRDQENAKRKAAEDAKKKAAAQAAAARRAETARRKREEAAAAERKKKEDAAAAKAQAAKAQAAKAQQKRREAEEKKLKADAAAKAQASASASAQASATDTEGPIPAPPSRGTRRPPPTKPLPIPGQKKITDQQAASQAPKNTQAAAAVEGAAAGATETPTPLNTSQASLVNSGSSVSSPLTRAHATSEASRARKVLEKAENKLKAVQNEVNRERTTSEKQRTQEELQDFIKRSKPFVSMLVTLLQKYSHNGALAEAGLTWRDFPPMKLFEVAEKRNVPSEQWSEWIWDYVNDRLHTERRRKKFSRFPGDVSSGRGVLDLQYKQVTTTLMEALSEYLIGHYKPKIDQILRGGTTLKQLSDTYHEVEKKSLFGAHRSEVHLLFSLRAQCNHMGPEAMSAMANLVTQVPTIEEVYLSGNPIKDKGLESLLFGLENCNRDVAVPQLRLLHLENCGISLDGFRNLSVFLETYEFPLVVFVAGNEVPRGCTVVVSKGSRPYEQDAPNVLKLPDPLRETTLVHCLVKYYNRILLNPKTSKWRKISLIRACRYSSKQEQPDAQRVFRQNLVACGFNEGPKSKVKGDTWLLPERKGDNWDGIVWTNEFAQNIKFNADVRVQSAMFALFHDLLIRVGTPYTGTIEKECIFEELRNNKKVRDAMNLSHVDYSKFEERFGSVDTKQRNGVIFVQEFIEYAAAFRYTLLQFQKIFGKYADAKGEVTQKQMYKALQKDPEVRKYFGIKQFHYKQFKELFKSLTNDSSAGIKSRRKSLTLRNMVDFNMERKRQTRLAVEVPPMPDPIPRVAIKVEAKGEGAHFTIGGFANWIIGDQVRSKSIQKLEARGTKAKDFIFKLEGVEISDEKDTIFATAFKILKSFPRSITFELCTPEFGAGRYSMLLRANMRTQVDVQSQKVATLEKEDVVHVVQTEEDPNTGAIRGLVRSDTPYVGERVLYEAKSIKKRVSARVIALSPLTLQVVRSSRLPPEVSDSTISEASPALLTHPTGWISLKSSSGQVCVRKAMF